MGLLNSVAWLLMAVQAQTLREELDLFREYRGCEFCEVCCIGANRCGDETECRSKAAVLYLSWTVFILLVLTLLGATLWHCWRRGKGVNQT